jgi:hypothetical protein
MPLKGVSIPWMLPLPAFVIVHAITRINWKMRKDLLYTTFVIYVFRVIISMVKAIRFK